MEIKWIVIGIVAWAVIMMGGMAFEQQAKSQCRIAALQAGKNSQEIKDICK